jgi:hypothetical protein
MESYGKKGLQQCQVFVNTPRFLWIFLVHTFDVREVIATLNDLIERGVVRVGDVAEYLGVSRQILAQWRKDPSPNMKAKNASKLVSFLESVQGAGGSRGEPAKPQTPQEQQKPTGSGGVVMSTETKQLLEDILSLPPHLQGTLRQNIDALKLLAMRLDADKRSSAAADSSTESKTF